MIQLDETGAQYVQIQPHPYFSKAEPEWQKPYYQSGGIAVGFHNEDSHTASTYTDANVESKTKLWPFIGF